MHRALAVICFSIVACSEADPLPPPSIVGKSAEQAADIATAEVCEFVDRCGRISIVCADCDSEEECGGCQAELREVDYQTCVADLGEDFSVGFACEAITREEEGLVDECLRALFDLECPTVDDAEAWANGGGGDNPADGPEACDALEDIRYRCIDYSDPEGNVPEQTSG
jgi:hypothetical protein